MLRLLWSVLLALFLSAKVLAAIFCTECGAKYEVAVKFCSSCGTAIAQPVGSAPMGPTAPSNDKPVRIRPEDDIARRFLFDLKAGKPITVATSKGSFGGALAPGVLPFVEKLSMVRDFEVTAKLLERGPPDGAKFQYHVRLYALSGAQDLRWYVNVLRIELLPEPRVIFFRDQNESGDAPKRVLQTLDFDPRTFDPTAKVTIQPRPELETEEARLAAEAAAKNNSDDCDPEKIRFLAPAERRKRIAACK